MVFLILNQCFKLSIIICLILSSECIKLSSINKTYRKGVDAYSGERWSECIVQFEESLHLYKVYKSIIINCRLKCDSVEYDSQVKESFENLKIYEKFFHTKNCLNQCKDKGFADVYIYSDLDDNILSDMQAKKPYEYLHVCYFQMYALPKAASAAYTYLIADPDNEPMKTNLAYYIQQPEVIVEEVVDLESEDYEVLHKLGLKAYKQNNWGETIAAMEEVLTDFMTWENNCRAECQRQPEQEWSIEFVITLSNNIASLLQCKQQCQDKLKTLEYNSGLEFIADVLNYLQISYYHLDRLNDAAKAVTSYLVLNPQDEDMLENRKIYSTLTDQNAFVERSDIVFYYKRDSYEKKLLQLFHNE